MRHKVTDNAGEPQEEHQADIGETRHDSTQWQKSATGRQASRNTRLGADGSAQQKPGRYLIERFGKSSNEREQHGKRKIRACPAGENACPQAEAHLFVRNDDRKRGDKDRLPKLGSVPISGSVERGYGTPMHSSYSLARICTT